MKASFALHTSTLPCYVGWLNSPGPTILYLFVIILSLNSENKIHIEWVWVCFINAVIVSVLLVTRELIQIISRYTIYVCSFILDKNFKKKNQKNPCL